MGKYVTGLAEKICSTINKNSDLDAMEIQISLSLFLSLSPSQLKTVLNFWCLDWSSVHAVLYICTLYTLITYMYISIKKISTDMNNYTANRMVVQSGQKN